MSPSPKISLICSVFNSKQWIERYLHNMVKIINFDKHELILINPNSPDSLVEDAIINLFCDNYKNIKYIKLNYGLPLYQTWNVAIGHASGDYISNANPDDRKLINFIWDFENAIVARPEVDVWYADSLVAFNEAQLEIPDLCSHQYVMPDCSPDNLIIYNPPHQAPVWKKSLHDRFGSFSDEFGVAGDHEFWLRCLLGGARFSKLDKLTGIYFFNPKGLSTQVNQNRAKISHELKRDYAQKFGHDGPLHGRLEDIIKERKGL